MPKTFTDNEREYIRKRLREEAKKCLASYGIRKTTIDELVKRVNIAKGTFYLFYESKELLFYDVICEFHDEIQEKLMKEIAEIQEDITPKQFTKLIFGLYKMVDESFMIRLLTGEEMEYLLRKLPPDIAKEHAIKDNLSIERLFAAVPQFQAADVKVTSGALRGIFLTMLYKHEIGEDVFDDALKMMIYGVVLQIFEGGIQ